MMSFFFNITLPLTQNRICISDKNLHTKNLKLPLAFKIFAQYSNKKKGNKNNCNTKKSNYMLNVYRKVKKYK